MKASIYRYEVPVDDREHAICLWADPLAVGCRDPFTVEFWALAVNDASSLTIPRTFTFVGTGHPLPEGFRRHWGTAVAPGGALVWHLVEVNQPISALAPSPPGGGS